VAGSCPVLPGDTGCWHLCRCGQATTDDFLHVLLWGKIINLEEDQETKNLKCEVQGKDLDGDDLTLHIAI
jgi:hypothetical protein